MKSEAIVSAIQQIRDSMVKSNAINNPYLLSERMVELAQLNHMLAEYVADTRLTAKTTLADRWDDYKSTGLSSSAALAKAKSHPDVLRAEKQADIIDNTVKQTDRLISACQSHVKVKMSELAQQNLNQ